MKIKEIFCKHQYKKIGTLLDGGMLKQFGKIIGGQLYITCRCIKCGKVIEVKDKE